MMRRRRRISWKTLRVWVQLAAVLALTYYFLCLVYPLKIAWRPDLLFQLDPLTHLYLLFSGQGVPQWTWALVALALLFAVSRLFCGWLCPMGALLDFVTGLRGRLRLLNARGRHPSPPQPMQRSLLPANFDLYLLAFLLVLALFRQPLLWLLDPIVFSFKFLTVILLPVLDGPLRAVYDGLDARLYQAEWWYPVSDAYQRFFTAYQRPTYTDTTAFLLFAALIIGLELWQPRFWCRYICPLGALNRLTYRLHPLKRRIRPDCAYCLRCETACHFGGTAEDDCLYCMECIDSCAPGKISFLPGGKAAVPGRSPVGRTAVSASITGTGGPRAADLKEITKAQSHKGDSAGSPDVLIQEKGQSTTASAAQRGLKATLPDILVEQASCLPSSTAGSKPAPPQPAPPAPGVPTTPKELFRSRLSGELPPARISRRLLLEYAAAGAIAYPLVRVLDGRTELPADFIRPPGVIGAAETPAAAELRFTALCIKCGQCLKACPTNGLQPALTEAGLSALWTPRLISRLGYCEYSCNLCGQVCPTLAIPRLALPDKQRQVLGTAYFDRNRCIPFITAHNCTVCEEHCPTLDKAIKLREAAPPFWPPERSGNAISGSGSGADEPAPGSPAAVAKPVTTLQPYIDPALCIGCGICEKVCPVPGLAAVRVLRSPPGSAYAPSGDPGAGGGGGAAGDYPQGGDYPAGA